MVRILNSLKRYCDRCRQRRQLLAMDERMRRDLGLSRVDVDRLMGRYGEQKNFDSEWSERR